MRISLDISTYNFVTYLGQNFIIKMPLDNSIGIDNDEGGSNICKNFIFLIPLYKISEHFRFI